MSPGRPIVIGSQGQRVSITLRLTGDGFVQVEPKYSVVPEHPGLAVAYFPVPDCPMDIAGRVAVFNPHVSLFLNGRDLPAVFRMWLR